ncbi:MAG: M20 family metallopeptidase [Armatimonadota bacterium]
MTIPTPRLAARLSELVRIPSVSPAHGGPRAGEPGEARLAAAVEAAFRELGGETHRQEVAPGRPNVFGIWRGESHAWIGVDVHMDTVSVEQMPGDPFSGEVKDGRVWGRGAVDTKATLAVVLALLEQVKERGARLPANLLVCATVDEEHGATGAAAAAQWIRDRGLRLSELAVAEPTRCRPVYAHKGVLRLEFCVRGTAAHSSQPHLGQNAITAAAELILAMRTESRRLAALEADGPVGLPTVTVTRVEGGRGQNVVPDECRVSLDCRLVPGEHPAEVASRLREIAERKCPLPVETEVLKKIAPFYQDPEAPWVHRLAGWSGSAPGVAPYCTNAWAYRDVADQCVVIGPGSIDQAHGDEEWVELSELEKLAQIYARWWGISSG